MVGIYGATPQAIKFAYYLINHNQDVLLASAEEEEIELIKENQLYHFSKKQQEKIEEVLKNKKLVLTSNIEKLLTSQVIFLSSRMLKGETSSEETIKFLNKDLISLLRKACYKRIKAVDLKIFILDSLPFNGFNILTENILNTKFEVEEDYLKDGISEEEILPVKDGNLQFAFGIAAVIQKKDLSIKQVLLGAVSDTTTNYLASIFKEFGVNKNKRILSSPTDIENALILTDVLTLFEQSLINTASEISNPDLLAKLIKEIEIPTPRIGYYHKLYERTEALVSENKSLTQLKAILKPISEQRDFQISDLVKRLISGSGNLEDKKICIIGIHQHADSSDMRGASFILVAQNLAKAGAHLNIFAPKHLQDLKWRLRNFNENITYAKSFVQASKDADLLLVLGKPQFSVDLKATAKRMKEAVLCDPFGEFEGRRYLDLYKII